MVDPAHWWWLATTVVIICTQSTNTLKLRNKKKICVAAGPIDVSFFDAILVLASNQ
jgi:hypothetical protein